MTQKGGKPMRKSLALDLFCGGGGACIGMQQAGFEVVGIDIKPHTKLSGTLHPSGYSRFACVDR